MMHAQSRKWIIAKTLHAMIPAIALGAMAVPAAAAQDQGATARGGKALADTVKRSEAKTAKDVAPQKAERDEPLAWSWGELRSSNNAGQQECAAQANGRQRAPAPTITHEYTRCAEHATDTQGAAAGIEKSDIRNSRAQARTGGFDAEYSGATGGVASRVTDSGEAQTETPPPAKKAPPEG